MTYINNKRKSVFFVKSIEYASGKIGGYIWLSGKRVVVPEEFVGKNIRLKIEEWNPTHMTPCCNVKNTRKTLLEK